MEMKDLKHFKCKQCGKECYYMPSYAIDICTDCKIENQAKQLAELKAENERLKQQLKEEQMVSKMFADRWNKAENFNLKLLADCKDCDLKRQLKEKDKKMKILQKNADNAFQGGLNEMKGLVTPEITKQVCEKIRKECYFLDDYDGWLVDEEFLDQIENEN